MKSRTSLMLLAALAWPAGATAQRSDDTRIAVRAPIAAAASAIIPGAGQALFKSKRAFAYLAVEAAGLTAYVLQNREGDRQRERYRELSRSVARAQFNPLGPAGDWDYYERMEKFVASGAFDAIPGGAVDPETDATTYNGSMWLLARQTYWRDPNQTPQKNSVEYQAALTFYVARAVPNDMRWSWTASPDAMHLYKKAISRSNNSFRRAEQTAGVVIANHILSAVDAYVSVKMHARATHSGGVAFTAGFPIGGRN